MSIDPQRLHDAISDLADKLPDGWVRAFQLVEIYTDGSGGTLSTYYVDEADEHSVRYVSLPATHLLRWQALWTAMRKTVDPFTSVTIILENSGRFDADYSYSPLSEDPPLIRQQRWLRGVAPDYAIRHAPAE